jgi:hypothetical protein
MSLQSAQLEEQIQEACVKVTNSLQEFQRDGSGWVIECILKLQVKTAKYSPITGNSYFPLPKHLQGKKALLNIQVS